MSVLATFYRSSSSLLTSTNSKTVSVFTSTFTTSSHLSYPQAKQQLYHPSLVASSFTSTSTSTFTSSLKSYQPLIFRTSFHPFSTYEPVNKMSSSSSSSTSSGLHALSDKVDFSAEEVRVQQYWEDIKAFETSLKQSEGRPIYTFYDGPPFATGLPHYGHILAGTIKDTVTRYAHQTGHYVSRRAGWDCHGLPVEYEIDQKLGIKSRDDVMKMGVAAYNAECRSIVTRYTKEWESTVSRMGRWIDFRNDYKTMDASFMESVWWVFSQLYAKGLVYRGYKVMPYSTACTTPLSNFEAGLNYKDVSDPAIVVNFPVVGEEKTSFVAWTTTPWTLPSNLALAVNDKFTYVKVLDKKSGEHYILGKTRLVELYPPVKKAGPKPGEQKDAKEKKEAAPAAPAAPEPNYADFEIVAEFTGAQLVGKQYVPIFSYFKEEYGKTAFRVISGEFVTDDSGTGIVHCAPAFGEDDYKVCADHKVIERDSPVLCPVDVNGRFTDDVTEFKGRHVKEADKDIIAHLKSSGRLVKQNQIIHSYPFCWRSDTPLIYKAVPSWFVSVEKIKERLLACNAQTYWVPEFVKEKRFHNWLTDARDWAISRNRYWGCPLPIWISDDEKEIIVISSVEQLRQLSGVQEINDLHKDKMDDITIPSQRGPQFGVLKRVPEVFDCWFESGSMPYAQLHYPFENKEIFEKGFPADFIAEGLDQTRGWFYTLMVISTGLFDKPAFKNLIVNGLVLAADGKKMSKRLKNYPDPLHVVSKYGADALRLYLINSPVVRAEPLRFQEAGVHDVVKSVMLPWFHAYRFFVENVLRWESVNGQRFTADPAIGSHVNNVMDQWILSSFQSLISFVHQEMAAYRLYTVVPRLLTFIEQLTNWYVRMNRHRLKGKLGKEDSHLALATLFHVLLDLCRLMGPFTPFFVDYMYQNLRRVLPADQQQESVHYLLLPQADKSMVHEVIETRITRMQTIIELSRNARDKRKLTMKRPLKHAYVVHKDQAYLNDVRSLETYLKEEMNVRNVEFSSEVDKFILLKAEPNRKSLGTRLGKKAGEVGKAIQALTHQQLLEFQAAQQITVAGEVLTSADMDVIMAFQGDAKIYQDAGNNDVLVIINLEEDAELIAESVAREVTRNVQSLRKKAGLQPGDVVEVFYNVKKADSLLAKAIASQGKFIQDTLGRPLHASSYMPSYAVTLIQEDMEVEGTAATLYITRVFTSFSDAALTEVAGGNQDVVKSLKTYVSAKSWEQLSQHKGDLTFNLDGKNYTLQQGKHYFLTVKDLTQTQ